MSKEGTVIETCAGIHLLDDGLLLDFLSLGKRLLVLLFGYHVRFGKKIQPEGTVLAVAIHTHVKVDGLAPICQLAKTYSCRFLMFLLICHCNSCICAQHRCACR